MFIVSNVAAKPSFLTFLGQCRLFAAIRRSLALRIPSTAITRGRNQGWVPSPVLISAPAGIRPSAGPYSRPSAAPQMPRAGPAEFGGSSGLSDLSDLQSLRFAQIQRSDPGPVPIAAPTDLRCCLAQISRPSQIPLASDAKFRRSSATQMPVPSDTNF